MSAQPKWRRRKTARPAEIVAAAQAEFAAKGFAAARLEDIAARAGISKGALYLYFETKTDLFAAVVRDAVAPNIEVMRQAAAAFDGAFEDMVTAMFARLAGVITQAGLGSVAKMVIGESRNFPDLAKVWHDTIATRAVEAFTSVIVAAQERGEVRPGNPRLFAIGMVSPVLMGALWREVFEPVGAEPLDIDALLRQHAATVLRGMRPDTGRRDG